jgi:hypothetical protein
MASAARSAADRLNVQENAGPRTPRSSAAMRRSPLRHPLAELGSTAPNRLGGDPASIAILEIKADLSNEINELDGAGKPILGWREPI